jgi:hypothetical protein
MDAWWLLLVFLRASLLSVSGQTALPLLRQDLLAAGLTTDQRLIEALTIGRLGTGPGGLYIIAIGYFTMGLIGAFVALIATIIPPLLVVPLVRTGRRDQHPAAHRGVERRDPGRLADPHPGRRGGTRPPGPATSDLGDPRRRDHRRRAGRTVLTSRPSQAAASAGGNGRTVAARSAGRSAAGTGRENRNP